MGEPADDSAAQSAVGTVLAGRYQLLKLLGAGAMGAVYQAKQLSMDRLVAVKVMHKHVAAMPGLAPRFHREMKATSRIEHANTVRVFDFGSDENGQLFLAMEFLDGRPLSKLLAAEPRLPLARLVHIATQIARALGAAHAEGITHRDLKPDNVMLLDRYGERDLVKVVDFGIARFTDDAAATKMTADGALIGTPAYMSPEQAMGKPVDGRSDFYSLGVMLYEMAVGKPPFDAPTLAGILVAHATEIPKAPSSVADVAPALEQIILSLLEKDPNQRPQSAEEIVKALSALITPGTVPSLAVPTLPPGQESQPAARGSHTVGIAAVVLGVVALTVVAVVAVKRHHSTATSAPATAAPPAATEDARARLDALWRADGDPLPPDACRAGDATLVDQLATAAARLQGYVFGQPRPQDREALALLKNVEAAGAKSTEYWALVSRARTIVDDADGGKLAAQQARLRCPDWAVAYHVEGNALSRARDYDGARLAFMKASSLAPDFVAPQLNLGLLALARREAPAAVSAFDAVLARDPQNRRARVARGQAYLSLKQFGKAREDLEDAVLQNPDDAAAWKWLAYAREATGAKTAHEAWCEAKKRGDADAAKHCP